MVAVHVSLLNAVGSFFIIPVLFAMPQPAGAQTPPRPESEYIYEVETRARWLHGRQQTRFTPFLRETDWIYVDSLRADAATGVRTMHLMLGRATGGDTARVRFDRQGRVLAVDLGMRLPPDPGFRRPGAGERFARRRLFAGRDLAFPELRVRALVPRFRAAEPAAGVRWTDTLALVLERGGFRQEVRGLRTSTILRDTLLEGRTMWVVADSAEIRYAEQWLREERSLDTLVVVARTGEGTTRGRHVYDPERGLYLVRYDTTALAGSAELRYPDGRSFRTPARYERTRRIARYAPAAYAARREELRAEHEARFAGMVRLPVNEIEARLAARDTALRDSLIAAWQASEDAAERWRLRGLLLARGSWEPDFEERIRRMALEAGDTSWVVSQLARRLYAFEPFDTSVLRAVLPFMADPGLAFAFGIDSDPLYENTRQGLLRAPPAVVDDTAEWRCTPEACRLLAAQTDAPEPRLRALARIAQFVLDPATHAAAIETAAARGEGFVQPALAMMRGYLLNWPMADARHPVPGPTDDWRAWINWMNPLPPWFPDSLETGGPRVALDGHAANTLRVYELVSGRDIIGEIRERFRDAASDSARLVYGVILLGLEGGAPDPAVVAADLRSDSEARRALAQRQLAHLFRLAEPWTSDTAAILIDRLLRVLIEDAEPWPALPPDGRALSLGAIGSGDHRPDEGPVFILTDSLPPMVSDAWRGRATARFPLPMAPPLQPPARHPVPRGARAPHRALRPAPRELRQQVRA